MNKMKMKMKMKIGILPNVSKIYERYINKQLEEYFLALLTNINVGLEKVIA